MLLLLRACAWDYGSLLCAGASAASGGSTLMARGASVVLAVAVVWEEFMLTSSPLVRDVDGEASGSGSMLEARRLSGEEERWGSSASPFMMALRERTRNGDWLLGRDVTAEPASSIPRSPSRDRSAYAEAQGEEAADDAQSGLWTWWWWWWWW